MSFAAARLRRWSVWGSQWTAPHQLKRVDADLRHTTDQYHAHHQIRRTWARSGQHRPRVDRAARRPLRALARDPFRRGTPHTRKPLHRLVPWAFSSWERQAVADGGSCRRPRGMLHAAGSQEPSFRSQGSLHAEVVVSSPPSDDDVNSQRHPSQWSRILHLVVGPPHLAVLVRRLTLLFLPRSEDTGDLEI